MKSILLLGMAIALGFGTFGMTPNNKAAKPVQASDMPTVMQKYIATGGRYTKKSRIFVKKDADGYDAKIFHANHDVLERTTYYSEGALLMGDLDGGFSHINSGYANSGENMIHFRTEDGIAGLTTDNRTVDYTVYGKTMSDYFFVLEDLITNFDASKWVYESEYSQFKHTIDSLAVDEHGDYVDAILKQYQYFAAPMLLQDGAEHYLSPSSIIVKEEGGALNIRIYADSDGGKLTREDHLLAESRVYAELVSPGYYLVGEFGGSHDWQIGGGRPMPAQGENLAQIEGTLLSAGKYQVCQLQANGETAWFHDLDGRTYKYAEMSGNDISIKYDGNYSFYLNSSSKVYLDRTNAKVATIKFVYMDSAWTDWNPRPNNFGVHVTTDQDGEIGTWGGDDERMSESEGVYTLNIQFFGSGTGVYFYFYQSGAEKKTENILTGSVLLRNGYTYEVRVNPAAFTWNNNVILTGVTFVEAD